MFEYALQILYFSIKWQSALLIHDINLDDLFSHFYQYPFHFSCFKPSYYDPLIIDFLSPPQEYDFHVRWPTVRLLTILLHNKGRDLQEAILVTPQGISKLMDLLSDSREIIRNDVSSTMIGNGFSGTVWWRLMFVIPWWYHIIVMSWRSPSDAAVTGDK